MTRELLIDKYRPKCLSDLSFNHQVNTFLKSIAEKKDMPHLIIEGPRGSGKKLRTELYLKEKYGDFKINSRTLNLELPGKPDTKAIHTIYSRYHHQFNPSIHNIYDRSLMQCFINEVVHTNLLFNIPYKIVIVEDADLLSTEAQESLRRTLETCVKTCRFIFLVNNENRIISPIYSRCITVKTSAPTEKEIFDILSDICIREDQKVKSGIISEISSSCNRNLQKALNILQRYLLFKPDKFNRMEYDHVYRYCSDIVDTLIKAKTLVAAMDRIREILYELVNFCVDCKSLLPTLLSISLDKIPEYAHDERYELSEIASKRDLTIRNSSKDIYHVESFCLHIFKVVKGLMLTKQKEIPKIVKK